MSLSPDIERLRERAARVFALPAWGGFVYALVQRPHQITFPVSTSQPELSLLTVATLVCSLLACICAAPTLIDDMASWSSWRFFIVCSLPFLGMVFLLNPAGIGPPYHY